jgi:hypothetical protein
MRRGARLAQKGIAMLALMVSTVMPMTRHSETAPSASAAATASIRRDDATGALWLLKPAAPDDRFMANKIPKRAKRITCAMWESCRDRRRDCGGGGEESGGTAAKVNVLGVVVNFWAVQASHCFGAQNSQARAHKLAAMLVGSSTTSSGFQSIVTKSGVCSTRFSQARTEGKVERSKSQRSATWV